MPNTKHFHLATCFTNKQFSCQFVGHQLATCKSMEIGMFPSRIVQERSVAGNVLKREMGVKNPSKSG
jgi:hypothetical protein